MKAVVSLLILALVVVALEAKKHGKSKRGLANTVDNTCNCVKATCNCCFNLPVLGNKGCITYSLVMENLSLRIAFNIEGETVIDEEFQMTQKVSVCGKLSPKLHSLRYCITQEIEEIEGDLLKACTSLGLQSNHKAQSGIKLGCLLLGADQLTYGGQKKSPRNNFVKYWASKRFVNDVEQLKAKKKN